MSKFDLAVNPRTSFADFRPFLSSKEMSVVRWLRVKTGMNLRDLYNYGRTYCNLSANGNSPHSFAVVFAQNKPHRILFRKSVALRVSFIDRHTMTEAACCQVVATGSGKIKPKILGSFAQRKIARGMSSAFIKNLETFTTTTLLPFNKPLGIENRPGLEVGKEYQNQNIGRLILVITLFMAAKLYGGEKELLFSTSWLNLGFYKHSFGKHNIRVIPHLINELSGIDSGEIMLAVNPDQALKFATDRLSEIL